MKRIYENPKMKIFRLQQQFGLLQASLQDDGIHVNMSGYRKDSDSLEEDEEDDGWF